MSRLRIFSDTQPQTPLSVHHDHADISHELSKIGVRFEQWEANQPIAPGASQDEVIAAYRSDIDRLMSEQGYQAVDVISLKPDHPGLCLATVQRAAIVDQPRPYQPP